MLTLKANPTFRCKVSIPIPGDAPVAVDFVMKHRRKQEMRDFLGSVAARDDIDVVSDIVSGWSGMADESGAAIEFSRANLERLIEEFPAAGPAITRSYIEELAGGKLGN